MRFQTQSHIGKSPSKIFNIKIRIFLQNLRVGGVKSNSERVFMHIYVVMIIVLMCYKVVCEKQNIFKELSLENFVGVQKVNFEYLIEHIENIEFAENFIGHTVKGIVSDDSGECSAHLILEPSKLLFLNVPRLCLILKLIFFGQ